MTEPSKRAAARTPARRPALSAINLTQRAQGLLKRARLSRWFFFNRMVFARLGGVRQVAARMAHFTVREATASDLEAMEVIRPRGEVHRRKLAEGDICLIVHGRDRPAAMAWFEIGAVHRSAAFGYEFPLGSDGCWSYWVDVHPDFRLRGALFKLWLDGAAILRERGIRSIFTAIEVTNPMSLNSHLRIGFEPVATLSFVRIAGVNRYRVETPGGGRRGGWGTWKGDHDAPPRGGAAGAASDR